MLDTRLADNYKEIDVELLLDVFAYYKKALQKVVLAEKAESCLDAEFLITDAEEYAELAEEAMSDLEKSLKSLQEKVAIKVRKAREEVEARADAERYNEEDNEEDNEEE